MTAQPPGPYYGPIGPMMRELSVIYWARFQIWPESLLLMLKGAPVPDDLVREARAAHEIEQVRQREREARPSGLLAEEE